MATPTVWQRSVPLFKDGDPVKASIPNASTQVLADRTAALKAIVDSIAAGQQLVLSSAPLAGTVAEGQVVYLDAALLSHSSALAKWRDLDSSGGRLVPAPAAVYAGVVIQKQGTYAGDVLIDGYAALSGTALLALFGTSTPEVGIYYLSSLTPGTVELEQPAMSVRVLQYAGNGVIRVFPPQTEPVTHTHRAYVLHKEDWIDATFYDPGIVPAGALFAYNMSSLAALAQNLGESLLPAVGEPSFIYKGVVSPVGSSTAAAICGEAGLHVSDENILLDENGIWWIPASPPGCDLAMTVTSADTKGESLLHVVENLTPDSLTITTVNGRVKIGVKDPEYEEDTAGHLVVKSIAENVAQRGPVVEEIRAGSGIVATSTAPSATGQQGTVSIRSVGADGIFLTADVMNLNNAVTDTDAPYVFTLLPTGRTSSVTIALTLPNFGNLLYDMVVWAQFLNPGASQPAPVITDFLISPAPLAGGVVAVAQAATLPAFPATIVPGSLYLLESSAIDVSAFSKGTVFLTLQASNPSVGLKMTNIGVRLSVVDN